jgi:hypothetical protein
MPLPEQIPKHLRQSAVFLPGLIDGQGAWPKDEALRVIDSLKSTTIPVSEVTPYLGTAWGQEMHWSASDDARPVHRLHNESDVDYAHRSRGEAAAFIAELEDGGHELLFALTFPMYKDAA